MTRTMYCAYGDESVGQQFVTYATIVIPEARQSEAEEILAVAKTRSGATASDVLHCRELFSGHQRAKTAWRGKSMADIFDLYSTVIAGLAPMLSRKLVAIGAISDFPTTIDGDQWKHVDPGFVEPMPWSDGFKFSPKNIASLGAQGIGIPLSRWPGFESLKFWPDPDNSMIEMAGGRRRFSSMVNCYVDHGNTGENPEGKIPVYYSNDKKPVLLQFADLAAYLGQRLANKGRSPNDLKFAKLWKQLDPEIIKMGIAPDGGIAINIPNSVRDFAPSVPRL